MKIKMAITKVELANMLLGVESTKKAAAKIKTSAIVGTAHNDSQDGYVLVDLGGDVISVDGKQYVSLATTADVRAGDKVYVLLRGADGTAMGATVIGSAGGGDRTKVDIAAAAAEAAAAKADVNSAISMVNSVKAAADMHESQIDAIQKDIAAYKESATATYATKTDVDEKTGAITKTLTADYTKTADLGSTAAVKDAKAAGTTAQSQLSSYKSSNDKAVADAKKAGTDAQSQLAGYKTSVEETYAEKTELTEAVNQLSSTMTSNYSAFTDYRTSNDTALSKAQTDATNAQSTIDSYKASNDKAVADAKAAGTTAQNQLSAYKGTNDQAVADAKKAGTDAQSQLGSYKTATDQRLDELKNIADNAIESFYLKGAPTATNPPASAWTTDALKRQHAGDLYMDTDTGYSYRWSGTEWVQVKDSDVTKALKEIESVKTTYATKSELKATDTELSGKVSDSLTTAKAYTDSSIETEVTNRDAAIKAQADSINLSVSKTYTKYETFSAYQSDADSRIATANSNASTAKSTAQTAAADAATAKTNASSAVSTANSASGTASKASTDAAAAVKTANAASSSAASAVETANSASSTANAASTTASKASTDAAAAVKTANTASSNASSAVTTANGAVTTANAANSTASAAKTTAEGAASTASSAKSVADSASSTAKAASTNASNAVSTANSANSKSDSAVSTAASASSTANAAKSTVDSMKLGGRNLLKGTSMDSKAVTTPTTASTTWGSGFAFPADAALHAVIPYGAEYRCSVDVLLPVDGRIVVDMNNYAESGKITIGNDNDNTSKRTSNTFNVKANVWTRLSWGSENTNAANTGKQAIYINDSVGLLPQSSAVTWHYRGLKVELGNKATDWTPAPEDTDSAVADAKKAGTDAQTSANAAKTAASNAQTSANNAQKAADKAQASADDTAAALAKAAVRIRIDGTPMADGTSQLMAHVYVGNDEVSANAIAKLGTLVWKMDGVADRRGTTTYTAQTGKFVTCRLEA